MTVARILGTSGGQPTKERSHSAIWCRVAEQSILFDCGEGTALKLLQFNLARDNLDSIIISHFHPDHSAGIFMVLQMFHMQKRSKPLTLYLPERVDNFASVLSRFYIFPARLPFQLVLKDITTLQSDIPEITPVRNSHLESYREFIVENGLPNSMLSYSFFIKTENSRLLFTSDIQSIEHLNDYIGKSDIIIVDGLHPPVDDIIKLMSSRSRKVILIHGISPVLAEILDKKPLDKDVVLSDYVIAEDGYQINV
jgi:ribonuclease BN (tRNA processing enzyme)